MIPMQIAQDAATSPENSIMPKRVLRDLVVERRQVDRLIPYIRNARTHTEAQVAQVAASIAGFGFVNPILVGADGVIIAGHARLLAARKLGMPEVPVIVLDHLSETQRRALVLADNRLALNSGWDEEILQVELQSLQEDGFNLDIVGFTDDEIEALLQDPEAAAALSNR
jgi:ParB-like chromosome segregation protein Spo0J